ncbi:YbgC/FadM family acyl-CoA thioesterase [Neisseriaceae bacterium PsAf]|nr:YbgC/FadM family acyl-CoA thioesterase [Neisseriaceae bacterium PsAf]MCV2503698.1 acyl-CoA thioesterase [Neisseriaceae bacterium]
MIFKTPIKVRGFHLDLYRHVNNARYLEFLEEARWDMTDSADVMRDLHRKHLGFVIVNININYRSPAVLGDELEVQSTIKEFNEKKGIIEQVIINTKNNKVVVDAEVTYVILDLQTQKVGQLDDDLMQGFSSLVENK